MTFFEDNCASHLIEHDRMCVCSSFLAGASTAPLDGRGRGPGGHRRAARRALASAAAGVPFLHVPRVPDPDLLADVQRASDQPHRAVRGSRATRSSELALADAGCWGRGRHRLARGPPLAAGGQGRPCSRRGASADDRQADARDGRPSDA